ncbi:MAG: AraC family transcriptional regulator [Bacteroidales bacterium]|jgi:AraC-like DNA-binding protein|nr:AraC family transcriptional regulator [Bacteroidales bacterium]
MEIIEPILYIAISQTFFAGLLVATKKPISIPDRLMAAFLFMIFFDLIFAIVKINIITFYSFPFVAFTYGPILYLYVKYMTEPTRRFKASNFLHFIPFVVFFVVSVIFRSDKVFTDLTGFLVADKYISLRIVYSVCFLLSITIYSTLTFITISRHQRHLKDLVSYESGKITLNWLKIISISFYAAFFILFIFGGINIFVSFIPFDPYYTVFIFIAIFSFVYSFYAIKQPVLAGVLIGSEDSKLHKLKKLAAERQNDETAGSATKNKKKYIRSGLNETQARKYLKSIIAYMEKEKPYLDRNLTIYDLSQQTGISRHHITQVLNDLHGRNFFTFINEYRVAEVISMMKDPAYKNYTLLAIAYDSGFNSKSTFNTIFKNITGLTPTQYLDRLKHEGP